MPRYAPKMTEADLVATIQAFGARHDLEEEWEATTAEEILIAGLMEGLFTGVLDDIRKIQFDFENTEVERFVTFDSGVTVALISAGGDWEVPLCFAIYYDGKRFRGYVPTDGNVFNRTLKQAYGNADEDEDNADALKHFGVDSYYGLEPDFTKVLADIASRIEAKGEFGGAPAAVNPAAALRKQLRDSEPDLKAMTEITPDLVMVTAMPAAGGSYFTLKLKHSGRELTRAEADKVVGIPAKFRREEISSGDYTWYAPNGMGSRWTAGAMEKAGFTIDPESYLQDYQVRIIRI
jgi:hypothetical protein